MALRAVTLLGENTVPILADLCRYLSEVIGEEVVPDRRSPPSSDVAAGRAATADVIWACGYLMCDLIDTGRVDAEIVAAPIFEGQAGPVYHSVIVAADPAIRSLADARGRRLAINEQASWSGHRALLRHLGEQESDLTLFADVVETGSHRASVEAVAAGEADVASIDHTVWDHLARVRPDLGGVAVIDRTRDWPAPPFAVGDRIASATRRVLRAAIEDTGPFDVDGLVTLVPAGRHDYDVMAPTSR